MKIVSNVRIVGVYDSEQVSADNALRCEDESMTRQEFKEEADINTIITRFGIGEVPMVPQEWKTDIDLTDAPSDYQSVLNQLNEARDQFMSLPAKLRSRFDNDPGEFMAFVGDSSNLEEMVKLGLAVARPAPVPSDTDRIIAALEKRPAQSSS